MKELPSLSKHRAAGQLDDTTSSSKPCDPVNESYLASQEALKQFKHNLNRVEENTKGGS